MRTKNIPGSLENTFGVCLNLNNSHYSSKKSQARFRRENLLYPIAVLSLLGIRPGKTNRAGYWKILCPFHKNGTEKNPSLNLHQVNGNYRCHTCGVKGGDILDFFMKFTGKDFIDAAKTLGAWEERS